MFKKEQREMEREQRDMEGWQEAERVGGRMKHEVNKGRVGKVEATDCDRFLIDGAFHLIA